MGFGIGDFIREVPGVGKVVENIAGDSDQQKIKQSARRNGNTVGIIVSGITGLPFSGRIASEGIKTVHNLMQFDSWVDDLNDRDAEMVYDHFCSYFM